MPSRSVGILMPMLLGINRNVRCLPIAPMNRPSSNTTLSLGASVSLLREITTSSAPKTRTAKSELSAIRANDSMEKSEAVKTPFVHTVTTILSRASSASIWFAIDSDSFDEPMNINRCKSTCHSVIYGVVSTYAKESNKDEAG